MIRRHPRADGPRDATTERFPVVQLSWASAARDARAAKHCDPGAVRVLGVDLAWGEGNAKKAANETGVAALDGNGDILSAGWTIGLAGTVDWIDRCAEDDTLLFVDAPLIVDNATSQRLCEREVGQRYWPWKVSANTTNFGSRNSLASRFGKRWERPAGGTTMVARARDMEVVSCRSATRT